MSLSHPIMVISYNDGVRAALEGNLHSLGVPTQPCSSFQEAEDAALEKLYSGILVDLQSIIKAKAEEKIVACSLTGFYPTLRVRALGSMIVPMAMPGDKKQDSTLGDFVFKSCASFTARMLRRFRRRDIVLPLLLDRHKPELRAFTHNLSWGGAFFIHMNVEDIVPGTPLTVFFPDMEREIPVTVRWVRDWGQRAIPGIGVKFDILDEDFSAVLSNVLNHDMNNARDRMVAR